MRCKIKNDDLKALFYCLKKEGVIEEHEKCEKQCSYCKMEKSLGQWQNRGYKGRELNN